MKVIYNLDEIDLKNKKTSVALGYFDGIHRGHKAVIDNIIGKNLSIVFTFRKDNNSNFLLCDEDKLNILGNMGVDIVLMPKFSDIKELLPDEFIDILLNKLNATNISCGFNYKFGKNALGDIMLLNERVVGKATIDITDKLLYNDITISSTKIKEAIKAGNIVVANEMLGYNYFIDSTVISGFKLGNKLGFPTINQNFLGKTIPKYAIYATNTYIDGNRYKSITNIGVKPTIDGDREPLMETYIIGLNKDLYGEKIKVELCDFIREERKFNSLDELILAINKDLEYYE